MKGRRVAVVEQLTKTVISFQKVATGAKERTLTLTANTEEELVCAKRLIEETIRRNVSPNRVSPAFETSVRPSLAYFVPKPDLLNPVP